MLSSLCPWKDVCPYGLSLCQIESLDKLDQVFSCFLIFIVRYIGICSFLPRYYQGISISIGNYYFVTGPNRMYTYTFWPRPSDWGVCVSLYISYQQLFLCHLSLSNEVSFWFSISIISCCKHKIHLLFSISFYPLYCVLNKYEYIFDFIRSLFDYLWYEYSTNIES
jgi:hypothetical protein